MQKDVILTPEGLDKLKQEIEHLSVVRRREVAERIKEAREFGDISENSEYDDAKNEQAMLEQRIAQLEDKLRSAQVIDASELDTNLVRVGSLVAGKDEKGKAFEYAIVGSTEADPANKRLSNESPGRQGADRPQEGRHRHGARAEGRAQAHHRQDQRGVARVGRGPLAGPARPAAQARGAARRRDRPVPARLPGRTADRRRQGAVRGPPRRGGDRRARPRSPAAWPLAAARARPRSSTSSTARAGCSCTRGSTSSARRRWTHLLALDLGDLIGADGTVFRTRRGELSLAVDDFTLLAKSLRPPPDKHHGLADVETRHRHRELDLIASEEARALFITRAKVIAAVRRFLDDARLRRGRDADPAAALRRRARRGRSSRTTTSSTATSTCGSPPSCTSSG